MQKGDNVLINYNTDSDLQKVVTFLEKEDSNNLFQDVNGMFILTDNFIGQKGITLTVIED